MAKTTMTETMTLIQTKGGGSVEEVNRHFLLLLAIMGLSGILVQENLDSVTVSAKYIQVELGKDVIYRK